MLKVTPGRNRHGGALLALVLAAALALSGCGGGTGQRLSPDKQASGNDINSKPRDQVRDGGTLRWPIPALPTNYNYNHLDGTVAETSDIVGAVMPRLFPGTVDGGFRINTDYLTDARVTATEPNQVVTYTINPKAAWSDGTPITWRDFEAFWRASNGKNPAFQTAGTVGYEDVTSVVRGTDDKQAVVTFGKRVGEWQALFEPLYPASHYSTPDAFNKGWATSMPVTAGPFVVDAIDQTAKTVTLKRNPNWWGAPAKLDTIIFRAMDQAAQPDALANNELDFYDVGSSVDLLRRAQGIPGVAIRISPSEYYNQLTFNGSPGAALSDERVRLAVAKGIDRQAIARRMIGQIVPQAHTAGNHIYRLGSKDYRDNSAALPFDPAAAERELDSLGWTRPAPGAPRQKDGRPLRLRLGFYDQQANTDLCKTVQNQLAQLGVTVELTPFPGSEYTTNLTRGNFDLFSFAWGNTPTPLTSSLGIYSSPLGNNVRQNYGRIASPEVDRLFAEGVTELDPARRTEIGDRIDQLLWRNMHDLPLYPRPAVVAAKDNLANFGAQGFATYSYTDMGFTK
ncbi:ABC transporter family substrate-binding protein [Pseudonocardia eucalypti]|uniref:ABC transporter family substrate-binding protein n=1 Tax=Pseudonocardia eucalypti TaxID=648755 RepID=A0ABP9Q8G8_9PSEU|nr:peptide/nickel transport system substrate-binding protein [Pseudonocardia eucalypti]